MLIGAATGATVGFVLNATPYRTGESVCTGAALMAGIGAAVDAAIGALVSR